MKPVTGLLLTVLVIALAAVGYLYYKEKQGDVSIELEVPKVSVD